MLKKHINDYVARVEEEAYGVGIIVGARIERERIIELIEDFQAQFGTGWDTVYSEGFASGIGECLALIKGENE